MSKIFRKSQGFTLIELMVVITIIAILSVVAVTVFIGVQKTARDGAKRADIDSIAKALESNKPTNSTSYSVLSPNFFAAGVIPTSSGDNGYCANESSSLSDTLTTPSEWPENSPCPTGFNIVSTVFPTATAKKWIVCARLEESNSESGQGLKVYCKASSQ